MADHTEALSYAEGIIQRCETEESRLRRYSIRWMNATLALSTISGAGGMTLAAFGAGNQIVLYVFSTWAVATVLLLLCLSRAIIAAANVFALRRGNLQDLKLLILFAEEGALGADQFAAFLVSLRRGAFEKMVSNSILEDPIREVCRQALEVRKGKTIGGS